LFNCARRLLSATQRSPRNARAIVQPAASTLELHSIAPFARGGSNQNSTLVFPIPIELIRPLLAAPVPMKPAASTNGAEQGTEASDGLTPFRDAYEAM
jgi:hypothetical protein